MSKYAKGLIEAYYAKILQESGTRDFIVTSLVGIDGLKSNQLRVALRQKGIRLLMVKNSLFARALKTLKMDAAAGLFLGPCAVAFGGESLVDVAKELVDWQKKIPGLQIKGAFLDGTALDAQQAIGIAKMPTLKELKGQVVGAVCGPGRAVATSVACPGGQVAGAIQSLVDRLAKQAA